MKLLLGVTESLEHTLDSNLRKAMKCEYEGEEFFQVYEHSLKKRLGEDNVVK